MKQVVLALLLLLFGGECLTAGTPKAQPEDLYRQTKDIYSAIEKMESPSIPEQQSGFDKLKSLGPAVLPFLAAHLKDKAIFLELARQIIEQGLSKNNQGGSFTAPLHNIGRLPSDAAFIEKYFYGRYLDALKMFDSENYTGVRDLVVAIMALERTLSFRSHLQLLKIQCDERIIQSGVLKSILTATPMSELPAGLYESLDQVSLNLKLENVSLVPVEINFGADNIIGLNVNFNIYDPFGSFNNKVRTEFIKINIESLKLNPNENKEWNFMLDIGKDSPESQFYKTYQIWAEISPLSIKSEALEKKIGMSYAIRKIVSNNIGLRVFPPEVAPVIKDPLNKLESAIKGGVPLDIFLCALLAPEPDQPQAIAMLIQALETPPVHKDRGIPVSQQVWDTVIMNCLKHVTKLPFEVNKATWLDWFKRKKR